jgi:hypothetical protein
VRTAATEAALVDAPWVGPNGPETEFLQSGADLSSIPLQAFFQYRVVLDTHNGAASPIFDAIEIDFP